MGFETATPIQEQAIPALMQGRDMLAVAQTGTGKTAAFLLPIINRLTVDPIDGVDTIILEPTRELAIQVDRQLEGFSYFTPVSSIAVYGGRDGHSMTMEMRALKKGADIIVATPGRLLAHLQMGYVKLDSLRHLVLDEADRMLDMGFIADIMTIVNKLPRERQNLLFSATMPKEIRTFSKSILKNPVEVSIAISKPPDSILQGVYMVSERDKNRLIEHVLRNQKEKVQRVLVFAGTKRVVRELTAHLRNKGFEASAISSDLDQKEREETLMKFKGKSVPILVATDVLSRGIDIKGIEVVINYDVPNDPEDYVHRIGRTARADATGVALTLVSRDGMRKFSRIEHMIGMEVKRIPLPEGIEGPSSGRGGGRGRSGGGGRGRGRGRSQGGGGRNNRNNRWRGNNSSNRNSGNRNRGRGRDSGGRQNRPAPKDG
ncbi:MAG TPA: DEAD/DEAH box helicase [Bacteroidetes bacterium]|nr:DEAD/DEAH box helicase [Bacteroidota bacterium]